MVTYAIDAATGQLRTSATQTVGDAHTLTGEPQGRYVFAAFGPRGGPPYWDPSIIAYAPDPRSGSLTTLSEASSDPIWCRCCSPLGRAGGWYWLSASATRVYGMWGTTTYHDWYPAYVTHAVDDDGQLGPAYVRDFGEWDYGRVTVDVTSDVFYKQGETRLTAHFVEPDGSLRQMGASDLCVDSPLGYAEMLVAVGGFLLASSPIGPEYPYHHFVCSWEGPRLAPRAKLALDLGRTDYAVALSSVDASGASSSLAASRPPSLVAMRTSYEVKHGTLYRTKYEVRLFAVRDGDLQPLDTVEVTPMYVRYLLFHPSGRFLYMSHGLYGGPTEDSPDSLTVCSIDAAGHLAAVQTLEGGGGAMAVTLPPAGGAPRL
ncbi:MAG TPA: hypothetical protein VLF95_12650 [Vicinamibacteria bacterium]|nr:hypothetical protein [Vicinamibacteria bacterium]